MTDYNFYYPNRFRQKTKDFDNIYNEWKSVEGTWGSAKKKNQLIDKFFGEDLPFETKISKHFSLLEYMNFEKGGSNIFHFKKELLELLQKTDVSEIPIGAIKFPFDNFYISLRELGKALSTTVASDSIIDGVFISFTDDSKEGLIYQYHISLHICGYSESNKDLEFKHNIPNIMELPSGLTFENSESTITNAISEVHKIMKDTLEYDKREKEEVEKEINSQLEAYTLLKDNLNLIVNCIIYISSDQPDIETKYVDNLPFDLKNKLERANTKQRKELVEKEAKQLGFSKIKLVGKSFSKTTNNSNKTGEVSTHWRRGHWRKQPYGKELLEIKLIWIKPTIVNKEKSEPTKGHIYTAD